MEDTAPLASLSLTHVYYDPDDPISFLCAWLALVPQALCVVYVTLIWSSREAEVALLFAGQLGCEAVNFVLKRLIKEERPRRIHGKGYGMPSSHAQFVAFWAVSLALFLLVRHRPVAKLPPGQRKTAAADKVRTEKDHRIAATGAAVTLAYPHRPWSIAERLAVSVLGLMLAGAVAWSRVYLAYHTPKQVLVGTAAGVVTALGWFGATAVLRGSGLLAWAIDLPPAHWFRIRDLVVEQDLPQAGWEKWQEKVLEEKARKKV